jgi:hypothetical protein
MPFYAKTVLICDACRGEIKEGAHIVLVQRFEVIDFGFSYSPEVRTEPLADETPEYFHEECYEHESPAIASATEEEGAA